MQEQKVSGSEFDTLKNAVLGSNPKPELKVAMGLSRQWSARKAGREVAIKTMEKLRGKKPNFVLLFSTIHYEKHGGFQELLNGVWEILPKGTPLIGSTVAGFMNNQGCFTRGVTALAVSYPNMDISVSYGRNTRRNPRRAAKELATKIRKDLAKSRYPNRFLYIIPSGITTPQIPGFEAQSVIRSRFIAKIMPFFLKFSTYFLQKGPGRERIILENVSNILKDFTIIGGASIDDNIGIRNYQFFMDKVYTNYVLGLGISSDMVPAISTSHGLKETGKKFSATKLSLDNLIIEEINNKPAISELLKILGWPEYFLDERVHRRTFFVPVGYKKAGCLYTSVMAFFMGDSIMCSHEIRDKNVHLLSFSGKSLTDSIDKNLSAIHSKNSQLVFIVSCIAILETLGSSNYNIQEKLRNVLGDTPFLLTYIAGEQSYSPNQDPLHLAEAFTIATLNLR